MSAPPSPSNQPAVNESAVKADAADADGGEVDLETIAAELDRIEQALPRLDDGSYFATATRDHDDAGADDQTTPANQTSPASAPNPPGPR